MKQRIYNATKAFEELRLGKSITNIATTVRFYYSGGSLSSKGYLEMGKLEGHYIDKPNGKIYKDEEVVELFNSFTGEGFLRFN